jgi:hypothetical protein
MKLKFALLCIIALSPMFVKAQSALTIFSEDGDKFYLVLNGQKQNTVPQTNIRIDGLSQPYYQAKIIFEDNTKKEISKNLAVQDPQTNAYADVTYKIKKQKDGDMKIRYFSAMPVEPNYVAPPDMYYMHFGQPGPASTTVTQTTVTTSNTNPNVGGVSINAGGGNGGVNMSINVSDPNMNNGNGGVSLNMNVQDPNMNGGNGGVNMNVNVQDPNMNATTTTRTTTTRTTTATSSSNYNTPSDDARPVRKGCQMPMRGADFAAAKKTVSQASFEDTKLSTAKTILNSNCFTTDQVMEICNLFSFEQSKLDFAKCAYTRCWDPNSYFKVANIFSFDASKTELNEYISSH